MKALQFIILSIVAIFSFSCATNYNLAYQGTVSHKWCSAMHRYEASRQCFHADTTYWVRNTCGKDFEINKHYWCLLSEGDSLLIPTCKIDK